MSTAPEPSEPADPAEPAPAPRCPDLIVPGLLCATMGLAPYFPEPHILGKLRWVAGGAHGMALIDWFDLLLHGTPWVILGVQLVRAAIWFLHHRAASKGA